MIIFSLKFYLTFKPIYLLAVSGTYSVMESVGIYRIRYFIQIKHMRNRNKLDWSKPFKLIDSKKAFDELDANDDTLIVIINAEEPKPALPPKREEIIVPKIDTVKRITEIKKFAKISPNYIRLPPELNLPLASNYELTEVDHIFLRSHQDRFQFKGKKVLSADFLRRAIVDLQLKAGKDMTLPRSKGWMMQFLEKEGKELVQTDGVQKFAETIYNYWKNRREELKFPLLRQLWKPNPEEYNHMLAFRPREREKRSLRRTNRILQDEIIEQLFEQFDLALKLVDRTQSREQLKFHQVQMQLTSFYNDTKALLPHPDFLSEVRPEDRAKDKQRIRRFHGELDEYRARKESLENIVVQEGTLSDLDHKTTVTNFLATVIYEAQALGITYEKIYNPNNSLVLERTKNTAQTALPPISLPTLVSQQVPFQRPIEDERNLWEMTQISLKKHGELLLRQWQQPDEEKYHVRPCRDFLQYRRRHVDKYYFGSDDEGQQKDLKKNISASFKKFLQLQSFTRVISATSQN